MKWNNYTQKWKQAATRLHVWDMCVLQHQGKWNEITKHKSGSKQQLAFMCEMCAYYNTKANETKWLYTKVEASSNSPVMWEMCEKWNNYTQKFKQQ